MLRLLPCATHQCLHPSQFLHTSLYSTPRNNHHLRHTPSIPPLKKHPEIGQISHIHKSQLHPHCLPRSSTAREHPGHSLWLPLPQLWHASQLRQNKAGQALSPNASLIKPSSSQPTLTVFGLLCQGHSQKTFFLKRPWAKYFRFCELEMVSIRMTQLCGCHRRRHVWPCPLQLYCHRRG